MFQRLRGELKGAFDTIADEQSRLRAQQAANSTSRTSDSQSRSQPGRTARPKPAAADLAGPDVDPNHFIVGDETPRLSTPDPTSVNGLARESAEQEALPTAVQPDAETAPAQPNGTTEVSQEDAFETQAKLRKLAKLESKYQELLKAYRRAHARNSLIEPFEARLRETTPLTSISDPAAFVEYISQLSTKGDMVMTEFKKVSGENQVLKTKLNEAEQKTKAAYEEVTKLQQDKGKNTDFTASDLVKEEPTSATQTSHIPDSPSKISLDQAISSPKQNPVSAADESNGDMFSVEDEMPKLQAELQERNEEIEQLQSQGQLLKGELESARESAEHMMHDLEEAQQKLETVQSETSRSEAERKQEIESLNNTIATLEHDLQTTKGDLTAATTDIATREAEVLELRNVQNDLEKKLQDMRSVPAQSPTPAPEPVLTTDKATEVPAEPNDTAAKKKKNKKKKKKTGAGGVDQEDPQIDQKSTDQATAEQHITANVSDATGSAALVQEKEVTIEQLRSKLKVQDDLVEEIEGLRDELLTLGQEHVEAKEKIKELELEKGQLKKRCDELTKDIAARSSAETNDAKLQEVEEERIRLQSQVSGLESEIDTLKTNAEASSASKHTYEELSSRFGDLQTRSKSLESDLTAAQQLASSRYKEMSGLRDLLSKAQPELTSLRTELTEVKASRDDLSSKNKDIRKLELREESLRSEIEMLKKDVASKDSDTTSLRQKISQETSTRIALEETNRRSQRDLQRIQGEVSSITSARDTYSSQLSSANQQVEEARKRIQQLERQLEQLTSESDSLRDEISLKSAQHASAESLMRSVRDQASEMATQMKEARERCESLEEELNDAHRLMSERGREGETMRRLLSEVEQRAESRVKEMRERMEMAIQERDRAEDEANSVGRRKTREVEELKGKLRDAERDIRRIRDDKEDLDRVERDLRRQRDEDQKRIDSTAKELEDVRRAMGELRDALDDGERQARNLEVERTDLKRATEEAQQRLEKLQKSNKTLTDDLRSLRATRMRPTDSPSHSSRSSFESARRVASPGGASGNAHMPLSPSSNSLRGSVSSGSANSIDYVYLKNVLLQFLEKDKARQMQLVPVLSMLLKFDQRDEQKWTAAIAAK